MPERQVLMLPAEELRPNPMQPRRVFDSGALEELAASIRQHGILQPLTVRRTARGWELIAGERRLRAARLAGLRTVPCLEAQVSDTDSALLALLENLQRQDLHYLEEATALAAFLRQTGMTQEQLAEKLGRSPSAVANKLRLLRLSPQCASELLKHNLSERHARALLRLEDPEVQREAARQVTAEALTVAQTEALVERLLTAPPKAEKRRPTFIVKDVRLFLNTLTRGLDLMRSAGVNAQCRREDTDDAILLTIQIPRRAAP